MFKPIVSCLNSVCQANKFLAHFFLTDSQISPISLVGVQKSTSHISSWSAHEQNANCSVLDNWSHLRLTTNFATTIQLEHLVSTRRSSGLIVFNLERKWPDCGLEQLSGCPFQRSSFHSKLSVSISYKTPLAQTQLIATLADNKQIPQAISLCLPLFAHFVSTNIQLSWAKFDVTVGMCLKQT